MTTLLIADDSEIDRKILRGILESSYNIVEADSGYSALEVLNAPTQHIDGLVIDINMPGLGGFEVLSLIDKSRHAGMQIFLISGEAQKGTIIKAANFGVAGFFKKPFDGEQILSKIKQAFSKKNSTDTSEASTSQPFLTDAEIRATKSYAEKLRRVYLTYLKSEGKDDELYIRVSETVRVMLENYYAEKAPKDLSPEMIEVISQAAYFYDIGRIIVRKETPRVRPQAELDEIPDTHTIAGADLVATNTSRHVERFVKVASDICMHHHERCDGRGMPHGLHGSINNIYTQLCSAAIAFCTRFFSERSAGPRKFNQVITALLEDRDAFRPEVLELLQHSRDDLLSRLS